MQLVKVLQGGVDMDGDGGRDLSRSRIYYAGQSFGGIYGTQLLGLEPDLRAGVPTSPGDRSSRSRGCRLASASSSGSRCCSGASALQRDPEAGLLNFHENIPLRGLPPVTATPDETAIQELIDRTEWAQQAANPAAYAPTSPRR